MCFIFGHYHKRGEHAFFEGYEIIHFSNLDSKKIGSTMEFYFNLLEREKTKANFGNKEKSRGILKIKRKRR